jgi:putative ubiquitin-RnfH superfamily antitoxin RatB of RatAB toxin-antitoxin module
MQAAERIRISVVYALPDRQSVVELTVPATTTVEQAVVRSGLMERFPQIASQPLQCAVFGRAVALSDPLAEGERVEILRPLQIDPKVSRRQAAARSKQSRHGS